MVLCGCSVELELRAPEAMTRGRGIGVLYGRRTSFIAAGLSELRPDVVIRGGTLGFRSGRGMSFSAT